MQFSQEEIKKACDIACLELLKRAERFKPDKPVIRDEQGWICEKKYLGMSDDKLAYALLLQWNYIVAGSVGRITQPVHVLLRIATTKQGRVLRLDSLHKPVGNERECTLCSGFNERLTIEANTSLHEY